MNSILQEERKCYLCGKCQCLESHHIFGNNNRNKSEVLGLKVWLCHYCHNEPPKGVHFNKENRLKLQKMAQEKVMDFYNWSTEDFIKQFGRNYL